VSQEILVRSAPLNCVVDLARALAWPALVLALTLIYKSELKGLLRRLSRLSIRGASAEFREELARTETIAAQLPVRSAVHTEPYERTRVLLLNLAKESPRAAVTEAWRLIECSLRAKAETEIGEIPRRHWITAALRQLVKRGSLAPALLDLIPNLRHTRNAAVHEPEADIGPSDAEVYIDISLSVLEWLGFSGQEAQRP